MLLFTFSKTTTIGSHKKLLKNCVGNHCDKKIELSFFKKKRGEKNLFSRQMKTEDRKGDERSELLSSEESFLLSQLRRERFFLSLFF